MKGEQREKDRYGRVGLVGQVVDEARNLRRHPVLVLLLVLVLAGGLILRVLEPEVLQVEGMAVGDCIYVPTSSADQIDVGRPVGTATEVVTGLFRAGAERASCDGSHGHEVAGTLPFTEPAGSPYPGEAALIGQSMDACTAAFAAYVGHPVVGSRFQLTVAVPGQGDWDKGRRAGVCLTSNVDGTFLSSRAGGSGG
jgi:hypothetical protein